MRQLTISLIAFLLVAKVESAYASVTTWECFPYEFKYGGVLSDGSPSEYYSVGDGNAAYVDATCYGSTYTVKNTDTVNHTTQVKLISGVSFFHKPQQLSDPMFENDTYSSTVSVPLMPGMTATIPPGYSYCSYSTDFQEGDYQAAASAGEEEMVLGSEQTGVVDQRFFTVGP